MSIHFVVCECRILLLGHTDPGLGLRKKTRKKVSPELPIPCIHHVVFVVVVFVFNVPPTA